MATFARNRSLSLISHKLIGFWFPCCASDADSFCDVEGFYWQFLVSELFYVSPVFGRWFHQIKQFKPVGIASTFVMLNAATKRTFYNFAAGRKGMAFCKLILSVCLGLLQPPADGMHLGLGLILMFR
jgi:hypothetical protein